MNAQEIRNAYLTFYADRGHAVVPRAPLVPMGDPTTLFTGSGMQPMIPYLLGEEHPEGSRITNSQVCLRAQDIDDVGDDKHTTSFEMLGNWSLGDYFKEKQIPWIAEFLFDVVGLDPQRVYVSCYIGNEKYDIPRDEQAIKLWTEEFRKRGIEAAVVELGSAENGDKLGMQGGRIFLYDGKENWWSRNGNEDGTLVGDPCGPDSEMFFDFGEQYHDESIWGKAHPASDSPRFFEIGNNVFMGYQKTSPDTFEPLKAPNIDHGSGLERIAAAAIDSPDVYRISLLWPIIEKLQQLSGQTYDSHTNAMRIIADHLKGATFLAVDGVVPSNKEQGYVMRRLMRRAIMKAFNLGIEQNFVEQVVPVIVDLYADDFPEIAGRRDEVIAVLIKEEKVFRQTLRKGLGELTKIAARENGVINGQDVFTLYDTYGYPVELTAEVVGTTGDYQLSDNWRAEFDAHMAEQRARSQTAAKGTFKGGLGGQTMQHKKYHTATHLMYQSLRTVLGDHVIQHGSNITEERLRFDFSHPDKLTPEQIRQVEDMVNEQIDNDLTVTWEEHPTDYARNELHVLGAFGDRYGDVVKCYRMQAEDSDTPFSFEICGGPHVDHTAQLAEPDTDGGPKKRFKITKEESSSAGIRRVKAVLR